jgi:OmpA-OmpF porin, OOP family
MKVKKLIAAIGTFVLVLGFFGTAMSENRAGAISVTPIFEGLYLDKDLDLDDNPNYSYGLGLGYNFTPNWTIEGVFHYTDTETDIGNTDVDIYRYGLDAFYHFLPESRIVPYLVAGAGGITYDPDHHSSKTKTLLNGGGGLRFFLTDSFSLRADARKILAINSFQNFGDGKDDHWSYAIGATLSFGGETKQPPPEPAPAPVPPPPAPAPAMVPDTDGDGVNDDLDKCPDTPKGAEVDERGCWVIGEAVLFDFDKSELKPSAQDKLDKILVILEQDENLGLEIEGHTCNIGKAAYNQKLSERRAKSVESYFVEKGVSKNRLSTVGYGFSRPAASNDDEEGRAKNRRVEFKPVR